MPRATGLGRVTDGGTSGPPGGGGASAVPNLAALTAVSTGGLVNGAILGVGTMQDVYELDKNSATVPSGVDYVATDTGVGIWTRKFVAGGSWANQALWEADSVAGDDEATGAPGDPLLTLGEFFKRMRAVGGPLVDMTVTPLEDDPADITCYLISTSGTEVTVTIQGTRTYVYPAAGTTTLTGITAYNGATATADLATSGGIPVSWTASGLVADGNVPVTGEITTGAATGSTFFVQEDQGAKRARVSRYYDYPNASQEQPVVADEFQMYTVTQVGGSVVVQTVGNVVLAFNDCSVGTPGLPGATYVLESALEFYGCTVFGLQCQTPNYIYAAATRFHGNTTIFNVLGLDACLFTEDIGAPTPALYLVAGGNVGVNDAPCMVSGGTGVEFDLGLLSIESSLSVWASAGNAVTMRGGKIQVPIASLHVPVFGTGNTGFGLWQQAGAIFEYDTAKPSVTGTLGDASIGSYPIDWTMAPFTSIDGLCGVRDANLVDDLGANYSTTLSIMYNAGMMPH